MTADEMTSLVPLLLALAVVVIGNWRRLTRRDGED